MFMNGLNLSDAEIVSDSDMLAIILSFSIIFLRPI